MRICPMALLVMLAMTAEARRRPAAPPSPIDQYIEAATVQRQDYGASPGSLFGSAGRMSELYRDQRAYQLHDLVTVVVSDRASAVARGSTSTSRKSNAKSAVTSLAGVLPGTSALPNLAALGGESKLDGQGETSRETVLTTTLTSRVTHVLPNGFLVLEGNKEVLVNSERQTVTVRGICRPQDLNQFNQIRSDRLAELEVRVNGKGVVGDAVRRPFVLYRILLGLLPF